MAFTVAVFTRSRSPWWVRVTQGLQAALPSADVLVFREVDEWIGAAKGISGEPILLMGPQSPDELEMMTEAKELVRDREVILVLPRDLEACEARTRDLRPRLVLSESVRPEEVVEAARKMLDRSRRRLDSWDWNDADAVS